MVDLYSRMRPQRIKERREWRHDNRRAGLRTELAHALWRLSRRQKRDDQRIALLHVIAVQRREIAELREENERAQDEWARRNPRAAALSAVLDGPEFTAGGSDE